MVPAMIFSVSQMPLPDSKENPTSISFVKNQII